MGYCATKYFFALDLENTARLFSRKFDDLENLHYKTDLRTCNENNRSIEKLMVVSVVLIYLMSFP